MAYSEIIWSIPGIWAWSSDSILPGARSGLGGRGGGGIFDLRRLWKSGIEVIVEHVGFFALSIRSRVVDILYTNSSVCFFTQDLFSRAFSRI